MTDNTILMCLYVVFTLALCLTVGSTLVFYRHYVKVVFDWVLFLMGLIIMGILMLGLAITELMTYTINTLRNKI